MSDTIDPSGISLVNSKTNSVESVPYDNAQQALTSGSHNLQTGQTVNVINPEGNLVSLPSEQVPEALQSGYNMPTQAHVTEHNNQQKYGEGLGNEAKAAAASAARTATFGLSDVALTTPHLLSPLTPAIATPDSLKQLQERNPVSDVVGSIAGVAGSLAMPVATPISAAAKIGEAATEAARPIAASIARSLATPETSPIVARILESASGVAAKTLGSSVEGSIYGLGNAVSENALGDADLNAENVLHNVGYGALFGGSLGALLGTGEAGYGALKKTFGKDIANAGARDAITENAALNPTPQIITPPTSLEEIAKHVDNAVKEGYSTELPAKSRLLETNDILAGDSQYPAHSIQVQSLSTPLLRDSYKVALENPQSSDGQLLRSWEAVQKSEGANKLLPKFIQDISPEASLTSDAVEGGNHAIKSFTDQYQKEQAELKPFFKEFDKQAVTLAADPTAILNKIDQAIPEAGKYVIRMPEGYGIAKYDKTMPFSKEVHTELSGLLDALNKPEGITIADLRNVRESMRDQVNFLTAPRTSAQISSLRKGIMDMMQDEVNKANFGNVKGLTDPRELFKRYAINEENRSVMEHIFGGSVSDKATFAKEIKPEDVLNRLFSNTSSVKAAKEILGSDFDKIAANYLSQKVAAVTDAAKNGFSSNKFATFLKQKGPELEEALLQHPEQYSKIKAITDKMRILPDSPSINPSGTAKTNLIQKMQAVGGYLTQHGIMSIPGKLLSAAGEHFGEMQQHSEFNRILRSNTDMHSPEQVANKTKQYGAYSRIERMAQTATNTIEKGAKALFKGAEAVKGVTAQKLIPHEEALKNYSKLEAHLKDMDGNPEMFTNKLADATQAMHDVAPNINSSLTIAAVRATQFLRSKLPAQDPSSPLTKPYEPSKSELAKFNRYVNVVEHPLSVMKQLHDGTLTTESLETLQNVYPKLLAQMQQSVHEKLDEKSVAKMSYQSKIMASAFLGIDLSNSLSQPSILSAQIQGAQPQPPSQSSRPKGKIGPSQKGLGKLEQSQAYMTSQQQALARTER